MKKHLLLLPLLGGFLLSGCEFPLINNFIKKDQKQEENAQKEEQKQEEEKKDDEPVNEVKLVLDYEHVGGADFPTSWNDLDDGSTTRKATYTVNEQSYSVDFIGKWKISTKNKELQTKKDPVSYIRSASDLVVKRMIVETFQADVEVYLTTDHTGSKLQKTDKTAEHSDGWAFEYTVNSKDWSILAKETYKGDSINIYSVSLFF